MSESSFKVTDNLFLVRQTIDKVTQAAPVEVPTNHVFVIDVSGSMSYELPQIRAQLKKKLPKMLKATDTISIIWFSGRDQYGVLLENEPVSTLVDLKTVEASIDRWLRPVGMTSFEGPLAEAGKLVERIQKVRPGSIFSLMFMSDGCDNSSSSRAAIFTSLDKAAAGMAAATFVEYGYYADRPLLTAMAEKAGGSLIFAESFDKFEPMVDALLQKKVFGGKRVTVNVKGDTIGGFVWAEDGTDLTTFGVDKGAASVPEHTRTVYYLSPTSVGAKEETYEVGAAYAALSLFSVRMKPEIVLPFLRLTGDTAFIELFGGLYGKQKYSAFMDAAKAACFDPTKRLVKGYNPSALPREDAFTVLDMLRLLQTDEDNRVLVDHEKFTYNRIGRGRVDAESVLTDEEQAEVATITAEMGKTKVAAKLKELSDKLSAITNKPAQLKFEAAPSAEGYAVTNLTYNEEKPNISILVRREGTVDVSSRVPADLKTVLPAKFPTFIFRNYAIVKDGLVNVKCLPVRLSAKTISTLVAETASGRIPANVITSEGTTTFINFDALPVINRNMVKATSAKSLFETEWSLLKIQAEQKVYNSTIKELGAGKKSASFIETYGQAAADWLKEAGFTDYSGFSPKQVQAESTDVYTAKELSVAVKGFSSIPSLNEFKKQAGKGKFTASAALMAPAVKAVETFQGTVDGKDPVKFEAWLKAQAKSLDVQRRKLISDKAQSVFCTIVGQVWFTEFASIDDTKLSFKASDGTPLECEVTAKEVQVRI